MIYIKVADDDDDDGFVQTSSDVCAVFSLLHHRLSHANILQIIPRSSWSSRWHGGGSNIKCDNDDSIRTVSKSFSVIIRMILVIAIITIFSLLIWSWWRMWWCRCCWCPYKLLTMMMMMMKVNMVVVPFPVPSFVPSQHFSNHLVMTQNIRQPLLSASPP